MDTQTRRSPTAAPSGAGTTVSPTTVLLGLATIPRSRQLARASGLTSGTTSGTAGSSRNRLLRSTTAAPACAATGAHSSATDGPAAKNATSISSNAPGRSSSTRAWTSPSSTVAPAVRGEPRSRSSAGGSLRSSSSRRISRPTSPDAPTTATRRSRTLHLEPLAHEPTHLPTTDGLVVGSGEIRRAVPRGQDVGDRTLDRASRLWQAERVAAEHRGRQDGGERIRFVFAGDVGRRAMDGLVEPGTTLAGKGGAGEGGGRQHAHRACQHGGLGGEDVAKEVLRGDDVEVARTPDQVHGHRVHEDGLVLDDGILAGHLVRHLAPQTRRREDVRLVDRRELAAALAGEREGGVEEASDLLLRVDERVDRFALGRAPAPLARLAEVDAAGELAHHDQVDPVEHLGAERRRPHQCRDDPERTQVGVDPEPLAEPEQRLLRANRRLGIVPLGTAHGAEQHRVGRARPRQLHRRQRLARGVDRGAADRPRAERERDVVARHHQVEDGDRLGRHLGPDAIAGEDRDGGFAHHGPTSARCSRRCARRVSSLLSAFRYARALAWMMSVWLPCPVTVIVFSVTRQVTSPCASVPPVIAFTAYRSSRGCWPVRSAITLKHASTMPSPVPAPDTSSPSMRSFTVAYGTPMLDEVTFR